MTLEEKITAIKTSKKLHDQVEDSYVAMMTLKGVYNWKEKQRYLLADMALHLYQTAIKPGQLKLDQLRNNLHAIATISEQFIPNANLKESTNKLFDQEL